MCLTCGWVEPHNNHGNVDYLTIEQLEKAAKLDKLSLDDAVENLRKTVQVAKAEKQHHHR